MKRKFYFHRQNAPLDTDHVVYIVWIGESVKEQRILTQLVAWSFEHGATLRSWTEDIDFWLELEAERVFPGRGLLDFGFIRKHINAEELLILIRDNAFEAYEKALTTPKTFFYQIYSMNRHRIQPEENKIISKGVLSSQRKNLSDSNSTKSSIICFT